MIFLTQQERDKFATWLEQEAKSDDSMAKQLEQLKGHDPMVKHMKQRAMIFSMVLIVNCEKLNIYKEGKMRKCECPSEEWWDERLGCWRCRNCGWSS